VAGRRFLAGLGLGWAAIGVVLAIGGCGDKYERTTVSDPCKLLDRSLVRQLTGEGRGTGDAFGAGSWGCRWNADQRAALYLDLRVFKSRRYRDDLRTSRRTYEQMTRSAVGRTRFTPIKNVDGWACWREDPQGMEVFVRRYEVVARISYSGHREAAREHVKSPDIARLLAENLMLHL
jgi:hypothetical protein